MVSEGHYADTTAVVVLQDGSGRYGASKIDETLVRSTATATTFSHSGVQQRGAFKASKLDKTSKTGRIDADKSTKSVNEGQLDARSTVENTVDNAVRNAAGTTARSAVENTVDNAVENTVRNTARGAVGNTARGAVKNVVESTVGVGKSVRESVRADESVCTSVHEAFAAHSAADATTLMSTSQRDATHRAAQRQMSRNAASVRSPTHTTDEMLWQTTSSSVGRDSSTSSSDAWTTVGRQRDASVGRNMASIRSPTHTTAASII